MRGHGRGDLFIQPLDGRSIVYIGILKHVTGATGPQLLDQLGAEVVAHITVLVAAQPDCADQLGIDAEVLATVVGQKGQVVFVRVAVRGDTHDLGFTVQHVEPQVIAHRRIHAAERIRLVELLDFVDLAILAITKEGGGVFAFQINTQNGGFFLEAAQVIGT